MAGNSEFIELLSPSAIAELKEAITLVDGLDKTIKRVNDISKQAKVIQLPSQAKHSIADITKATSDNNKVMLEAEKLNQKLINLNQKQSLENAKLRVQVSELTKEQKKQAQEALGVLNAYQKLSNSHSVLRLEAKGLAAEMYHLTEAGEQNSIQFKEVAAKYDEVSVRANKMDAALKKIDSALGQSNRFVGNYERGTRGLGIALSQISRELPNIGQSFEIFLLSLSNQFGQVQDGIAEFLAEQKRLQAEGKPTQNIFKAIGKELLSLRNIMFVGIAVAIAYRKEISEFISSLFSGIKEINAAKESLKALTEIRNEGLKAVTQERIELQQNLAIAADVTLSYKEREIAAQKVLDQYPYFFKNLTKEAVLNGEVEEAVKGVNAALLARARANAAMDKITENQSKIIDLEQQQYDVRQRVAQQQNKLNTLLELQQQGRLKDANAILIAEREIRSGKSKDESLQKEINVIQEINNRLTGNALQNAKEAIGLDYQEQKAIEAKNEALKDFIASQYELNRTRLENEASALERTFKNEEVNLKAREEAYRQYHIIKSELAEMQRDEELRLLKAATEQEISELKRRAKEGEITEKNANAVIYSLQRQAHFDSLKIYEDYAENIRQVNRSLEESMKGVWNAINFQKSQNLIDERDLEQTKEYAETLQKLTAGTDYKKFEDAQRKYAESSREITKANIQSEIDRIEVELMGLKDTEANVQKRLELQNQLMDKQKSLTDVTVKEAEEQAEAWAKLQKATEDYLQGITKGFMSDMGLGSLNTFFDGTFDKLIEGANTVGEKFAVTFNAITEVAQDAFNFLQQNSQAYFDAQYARLNREKEIALKFAGENAAGREEIERQYEEKQREIRMREWKAEKEAALFNAVINTAQAVTAALPNIPLSILVGALGAAQIAMIAARPVPAYAEGVFGNDSHPGGAMLVNDGSHREVVVTPDGKVSRPSGRNVLMEAPRGTKVYPSENVFKKELDAMLGANNIGYPTQLIKQVPEVVINNGVGITKADLDSVMQKYTSKSSVNINIDKNGLNTYWQGQHTRTYDMANKINYNRKGI